MRFEMQTNKTDFLFLVAGAMSLSFGSVFVNVASAGPAIAGFYRMLVGGFILLIICLLKGETLWKGWHPFRIAALAGLFFWIDLTLWHRSIEYVGPGLATILGNCQVFFLAILAVLVLKEKFSWRIVLAVPLAMLGIFMIVYGDWGGQGGDYNKGVWFGLCTAVFYAIFVLTLRKSQSIEDGLSPIANITMVSLIAMIFMGLEGIWQGQSFVIPDVSTGWALLGYGVVGQVIGWVWITRGLRSTPASLTGLILLLQPALAFVWDILFFARPTDGVDYLGAGIALVAIYFGTRR